MWDFATRQEPDGRTIIQVPGPAPENGEFWSHALDRIKNDHDQGYAMARRHLPLPAAWREMAIALHTKIQKGRKEKTMRRPAARIAPPCGSVELRRIRHHRASFRIHQLFYQRVVQIQRGPMTMESFDFRLRHETIPRQCEVFCFLVGVIEESGAPAELFTQPKSERFRQFLSGRGDAV